VWHCARLFLDEPGHGFLREHRAAVLALYGLGLDDLGAERAFFRVAFHEVILSDSAAHQKKPLHYPRAVCKKIMLVL
jgi:hypothetical protein